MATLQSQTKDRIARREEWKLKVVRVLDQIAGWARAEGWQVDRQIETQSEPENEAEDATVLHIKARGGELELHPVSLHSMGAEGRIDIFAFPTIAGVRLVPRGEDWEIMTDSRVPLRVPWNSASFVQLAHDLLA